MFDQLLAIVNLKKELPDAVGYHTFGPMLCSMPKEILDVLPDSATKELKGISIYALAIDNYSNKTQKNIRILFSGEYEFSPKLSFERRNVSVKYEVDIENRQVCIDTIPPNESINIEFFNVLNGFKVEQVLIGDNEITKLMQRLAKAKRYPEVTRMKLMAYPVVLIAVAALCSTMFFAVKQYRESDALNLASANLESCRPYMFDNALGEDKLLDRKLAQVGELWVRVILAINKVGSIPSLKLKDDIILCTPNVK